MTDIELLKAAAKAAGIEVEWKHGCGHALHVTSQGAGYIYWNPLIDDGQAFRLANSLRLTVYHDVLAVIVKHKQYSWEWMGEGVDADTGDRDASTRRVIVRAAAAMAANTNTHELSA
jgi:hypothetical protein